MKQEEKEKIHLCSGSNLDSGVLDLTPGSTTCPHHSLDDNSDAVSNVSEKCKYLLIPQLALGLVKI